MPRPSEIRCDCIHCNPPVLITWNHVLLVGIAGSAAMIIDLAGYTPVIAQLLGLA